MGKFDKEIKAGLKIADGWMKTSKDAETFFVKLKKQQVAWEKTEIKKIEAMIARHDEKAVAAIAVCRKFLKEYEDKGQAKYQEHFDFARGEPRKGSVPILAKLKITEKDESYNEVKTALNKVLLDHTKQVKATESAWISDLSVRLKLLFNKLDTLEKLATGAEKEVQAYGKQLVKDYVAFQKEMAAIRARLKTDSIAQEMPKMVKQGPTYRGGDVNLQKQQYQLFVDRLDSIPGIAALVQKNYGRIMKSVPAAVRSHDKLKLLIKRIDDEKAEIEKELKVATGVFKAAKATFEKTFKQLV